MRYVSKLVAFAKSVFALCATLWVVAVTAWFLMTETRSFLTSFLTYAVISLAAEAFFTGVVHVPPS